MRTMSLEIARDMMEQQKSCYVEMLKRQETNFMSFTKMILESTTTSIDGEESWFIWISRNNVTIDGLIQDNAYESWSDTEQKVREFLNKKLNTNPKSVVIERANRTGNVKQNSGKARPIVVKSLTYKDKEHILAKA